jgi:hypothetical protein
MRFLFKELPGTSKDYPPAVPVTVEGLARAPQLCLLDLGALHNRFGALTHRVAPGRDDEPGREPLQAGRKKRRGGDDRAGRRPPAEPVVPRSSGSKRR